MNNLIIKVSLVVLVVLGVVLGICLNRCPRAESDGVVSVGSSEVTEPATEADMAENGPTRSERTESVAEESPSEEEKREAEEERLVDDFDNETDRWMDADSTKPPTMKEVEAFRAKFKRLPMERREECLQRALNLIPDQNVMLLAGILLDKSADKELVELVFNDVLNRDETVKKPILELIFKDKSHPCWADTAWILDVTGELPKNQP